MMDFYSDSYSLFTGLFAAIFGMSFPLILQCIQRIDEKYESSVISREFEKEAYYRWFKGLLWPYIILVCASPLLMGWISNIENLFYCFQCFMLIYILAIAVVMVLLFTRITAYYNMDRLLDSFDIRTPDRDVLFCFDLAKYASDKGYQDIYIKAMGKVAECFRKERDATSMDKPVEYSGNLNRVLFEIGRSVGDGTFNKSGYKSTDIVSFLLDSTDDHIISETTFRRIWYMLNNAAAAGNNDWIKDYWTWASQYYQFRSNRIFEGVHNAEMKEFYRFNVMLGAVLNFNKRYDCMQHIMSVCPNSTNRYPLIPGTFSQILELAKGLDTLLAHPMQLESKYQIIGLNRGVNTDEAIIAEAYQYLAILFVRIWSYRDYNINYCNPMAIPYPSTTSIDDNDASIRIMGVIKRNIDTLYQNGSISQFGFSNIPIQEEVQKVIDEYIENCQSQNKVISAQKGYSKEKLQHIYDEAVVVNVGMNYQLPSLSLMTAKENPKIIEETIEGTISVEHKYLHHGTEAECGGVGQGLALDLNLKLRQALYDILCKFYIIEEKEVAYNELQGILNEMSGDNVILDFTGGCEYSTSMVTFQLGKILYDNVLFVCSELDAPSCDIIDGKYDEQLIDAYNFLYGSVEEQESQYIINIKQKISIQHPQGKPAAALIIIK